MGARAKALTAVQKAVTSGVGVSTLSAARPARSAQLLLTLVESRGVTEPSWRGA